MAGDAGTGCEATLNLDSLEYGNDVKTAIANKHEMPKKQWAKLSPLARVVFNEVYREISSNQAVFTHPKAEPIAPSHWTTIAWNAAWVAASHVKANQ